MSKLQTWQAVQDWLTTRRIALNEEIAAYPGPITGCDAQFNHLLEQRAGLIAELARLDSVKTDGVNANTLTQFMESCPFLDGADGEIQQ